MATLANGDTVSLCDETGQIAIEPIARGIEDHINANEIAVEHPIEAGESKAERIQVTEKSSTN
jgi:hypothetical protein